MLLPFALQTALQADPEITRVMIERTWLDQVATVGQSLVSVLVLFMLVAATITLFALRRALDELTRLVKSTSADITGAVHDARVVVEEIRNLSGRVRGTADVVRAGVRRARGFVDKVKDRDKEKEDDEDTDETPAIRDRPERGERGEREREPRPPRAFEEQSMADTNRDERAMRKRRRRRRGNDRPPRAPGEERSSGGDSDAGSGEGPE